MKSPSARSGWIDKPTPQPKTNPAPHAPYPLPPRSFPTFANSRSGRDLRFRTPDRRSETRVQTIQKDTKPYQTIRNHTGPIPKHTATIPNRIATPSSRPNVPPVFECQRARRLSNGQSPHDESRGLLLLIRTKPRFCSPKNSWGLARKNEMRPAHRCLISGMVLRALTSLSANADTASSWFLPLSKL